MLNFNSNIAVLGSKLMVMKVDSLSRYGHLCPLTFLTCIEVSMQHPMTLFIIRVREKSSKVIFLITCKVFLECTVLFGRRWPFRLAMR
jgi:hypothetical protein